MPIRAILLDKDGTLVDLRATWAPAWFGAARALASAAGRPDGFARELLRRLGFEPESGALGDGSPLAWASNAAIVRALAAEPELAGVAVEAIALAHLRDIARYPPQPVGDLPGLLGRLAGRGLVLGMATMDEEAAAQATIERLGLGAHLAFVAGCDSGFGHKPGPGMALAFCAATGVPPSETAVVGDTPADLLMARAAGCALAVAVRGGGAAERQLAGLADRLIDDVHGLEAVLDELDSG